MNTQPINDNLDFLLEGAFYELSQRQINTVELSKGKYSTVSYTNILHGVFCNVTKENKQYNFIFQLISPQIQLSSVALGLTDLDSAFDKVKNSNNLYYAFISLERFAAESNTLRAKYMGKGVTFSRTKEREDSDIGFTTRSLISTLPFEVKVVDFNTSTVSSELTQAGQECTKNDLNLDWLNNQEVAEQTEVEPFKKKVSKPIGATLRQKLAILKHMVRVSSIMKKQSNNAGKLIDISTTLKKLIADIESDVSLAMTQDNTSIKRVAESTSSFLNDLSTKNPSQRAMPAWQKALQDQKAKPNSSQPSTPVPATPTRPSISSNGNVDPTSGGKATKEYKTYNKRRYVVRQGVRGGKYIQVGDKKIYV